MFSISMFLDVHTTYISIIYLLLWNKHFLQVSNRYSFQKQMFSILAIKKIIECNEKRNTHTNTYLTFVIWDAELQKNLQNADLTSLKVSKFQNCKNYFPVLQERNLYKFLFIFWSKDDFINPSWNLLTLSPRSTKLHNCIKKQTIYYHLTYWLDHIILVVHQLGFSIYIFKVVNLLLNTCRYFLFSYLYLSLIVYFFLVWQLNWAKKWPYVLPWSVQNHRWKLGQQNPICWNYIGLFRDYCLDYIHFRDIFFSR